MDMEGQNGSSSSETVKLFVGQIPRQMTEEQLLSIFQEAGNVHEISLIKDKATKQSRGCCFLIYTTKQEADNAIALFHNKRKLPPVSTPLQVKYAEGELERLEHKLFIGMLPKSVSDSEVSAIFSQFGTIKELTVIKGSQASKAGCAFLKFETRDQAIAAIKALNGVYKMEGSTSALVVKWADTEKERQARKAQKGQPGSVAASGTLPGQQPSVFGAVPSAYTVAGPINGYGYQAQSTYGMTQYPTSALSGQPGMSGGMLGVVNPGGSVPGAGFDMAGGAGPLFGTSYTTPSTGYVNTAYPTLSGFQYPAMYQGGLMGQGTVGTGYQAQGITPVGLNPALSVASAVKTAAGPQVEGPTGANLFIYHLPQEFGDPELSTAFSPFGNVISAKVFVDKATGLSKCFGFVSYDSPDAAQAAINAMNGSQLGGKRLKVQLKRDGRQSKPY